MRGYSGKATKWVDFVMTDSTRRESCHSLKVKRKSSRVKERIGVMEVIDFMVSSLLSEAANEEFALIDHLGGEMIVKQQK